MTDRDAPTVVVSGHAVHSLTEGGGLQLGGSRPTGQNDPDTTPEPADQGGPAAPGTSGVSGESQWLTADDVDRLPYRSRHLAFLAACSSGQIATDLPDEAIGLPSSLLRVGFASVISTLWPVADHTAFVTLTRYLQLQAAHPGTPPAETLPATRQWLRALTRTELLHWIDTEVPPGPWRHRQ